MEEEMEKQLPVLDELVTRTVEDELQTSVYRKAAHTDQLLNFNSHHPKYHNINCIRTLFRRIESYCHTVEAKRKEVKHLFMSFIRNGYPRSFIRRHLNRRSKTTAPTPTTAKSIALPYIENVTEKTARLLKSRKLMIAHIPTATLKGILSRSKEKLGTPTPKCGLQDMVHGLCARLCGSNGQKTIYKTTSALACMQLSLRIITDLSASR
ncbi:unnamed protein product [Dicrocoelium dendriticum]|nr:unnamed protein product [Dicrocoelium dendriticum]